MKRMLGVLLLAMLLPCLSTGAPYDPKTGYIQQIDVSAGENMGFRVLLKDVDFECGSGSRQAYINESYSNYDTFTSVLLAAKMSKTKVRIYNAEGTSQHCKIIYVILLDE
ncbi:MAG: hypothetical protein ACFHVJ_12475 [Aestuariibacter sp.]